MLCFQDCVDFCDLNPEDEKAVRENLTLAELAEALAHCPQREGRHPSTCAISRHLRFKPVAVAMPERGVYRAGQTVHHPAAR